MDPALHGLNGAARAVVLAAGGAGEGASPASLIAAAARRGRSVRSSVHAGRAAVLLVAALLFAGPLLAALGWLLHEGWAAWAQQAFARVLADGQVARAWALAVGSATLGAALALAAVLGLATALHGTTAWRRVEQGLGPALAVPHAAFAVGLALWLMPAGWLARALAPVAGWTEPPAWVSVHDPWGLGLAAVLALKEAPFLAWCLAALLARPEVAAEVQRTEWVARCLGYRRSRAWWLLVWPRWLPRLAWPLAAVWAYGLTVVDVALVIGPTNPPTLGVLAWQNLADGDAQRQADGVSQVVLLGLTLLLGLALAALAWRGLRALARQTAARGLRARPREAGAQVAQKLHQPGAARTASLGAGAMAAVYLAVVAALALASVTLRWPFPQAWPQALGLDAWVQAASAADALRTTLLVAGAATLASTALVVAWFEATPAAWDRWAAPWVLAPLVVPPLLWLVGLYGLALHTRLDGRLAGLVWVHGLMVVPYVFITLAGAWRSFDPAWQRAALALGRPRSAFFVRVKLPMLRAPLAAALAVGFAVSVAQYLPTQFIGAGRLATVTTETVALAAGGQRMQAATFALVQAVLPLAAFGLAAWLGRRRFGGPRP